MKEYKITMAIDKPFPDSVNYIVYNGEHTTNWSGYGETSAIAQAMLYYAQQGARSLEVIEATQI